MYENTIKKILSSDPITSKIFIGVFARDEIPAKLSYPCCFVVNTHPRSFPGQHWLAFYYDDNGMCEFFDSYGHSPKYFNFINYIKKTANKCRYNSKRIQGQSYLCGFYCILYLLFRARNHEKKFLNKFTSDLNKNDRYILSNIKKYSKK